MSYSTAHGFMYDDFRKGQPSSKLLLWISKFYVFQSHHLLLYFSPFSIIFLSCYFIIYQKNGNQAPWAVVLYVIKKKFFFASRKK